VQPKYGLMSPRLAKCYPPAVAATQSHHYSARRGGISYVQRSEIRPRLDGMANHDGIGCESCKRRFFVRNWFGERARGVNWQKSPNGLQGIRTALPKFRNRQCPSSNSRA
jgi:hypothetical protein